MEPGKVIITLWGSDSTAWAESEVGHYREPFYSAYQVGHAWATMVELKVEAMPPHYVKSGACTHLSKHLSMRDRPICRPWSPLLSSMP